MARRRKSKAVPFNVGDITALAKSNPYVQQLLNDDKLRKNVRTALASGQRAYGRLSNGKVPARALLEDKRLHGDLGKALGAARDATITITTTQRKRARKGLTFGRVLIIGGVGAGVAVATSEKLRSKVLDMLFGAEEEFQYTPPPNSSSAESTATVGAA
ncbi:MAG: hypothetical protein ACJ764_15520 [Solirubrobacteraceae bacterium]